MILSARQDDDVELGKQDVPFAISADDASRGKPAPDPHRYHILKPVIPAKAGTHCAVSTDEGFRVVIQMGPGFRRDDGSGVGESGASFAGVIKYPPAPAPSP